MLTLFPDMVLVDYARELELKLILDELFSKEYEINEKLTNFTWKDNVRTSSVKCKNVLESFELEKTKAFIDSKVNNYLTNCAYFNNFTAVLDESWVNVIDKYGYQDLHVHTGPEFCISGVFYLRTSGSDGDLAFFPGFSKFYKSNFVMPPETGKIIIFSGDLPHRVEFNKSENTRISLSFNYKLYPIKK